MGLLTSGSCVRMISGLVGVYLSGGGGSQMLLEGRVKFEQNFDILMTSLMMSHQ